MREVKLSVNTVKEWLKKYDFIAMRWTGEELLVVTAQNEEMCEREFATDSITRLVMDTITDIALAFSQDPWEITQ